MPLFRDDLRNRDVGRVLRIDIEFKRAQIYLVVARKFLDVRDDSRVAAGGLTHRRVYRVAGFRERVGGQPAKAAGRTGDDDNLFHDIFPFCAIA